MERDRIYYERNDTGAGIKLLARCRDKDLQE